MSPYLSAGTVFFFFLIPKLIEANIKKIKKKKKRTANPGKEEKRKKKKKKEQPTPTKKKKKKVKRWSKVATVGPLCVFNYNIAIEL